MKAKKFMGLLLALSLAVTTAGTSIVPVAAAPKAAVQSDSRSTATEAEKLEQDKNALNIPASAMADSIVLPQKSASGFDISWVSDNAAIRIEDGKGIVTRGTGEITVKLTATITGKEIISGTDAPAKVSKDFNVLVPTEKQVLDAEVNALSIPESASDDFDLPDVSQNGYSVTWTTETNNFIKIEGKKAIVTAGDTAGTAKLTATVKGKSLTSTREFTVNIPVYYLVRDEVKEITGCFAGHPEWGQPLSNLNDNSVLAFWNAYDDPRLGEADYKQEVAYEFKRMMELDSAIITWADNGGVVVPSEITFKYWDIVTDTWKDVTPKGDWVYTGSDPAGAANTYNFDAIVTNKLRLVMTNTVVNGAKKGVGIYEWNLTGSRWVKNLSDLNTAISAAEAVKNTDGTYTAGSFTNLQNVIREAKAVAAKGENAAQDEINLYILKLPIAIDGLKPALVEPGPGTNNKTALAAEITEAGKLVQSEYTDASWTPFDTAYKAAVAVNDKADATQEEIDAAVASLKETAGALIIKGSEKELDLELAKLTLTDRASAAEITLPNKNADGFAISWASDNAAIVVDNEAGKGTVTRGESEVTVKLTATITAKNTIGSNEKPLTKAKEFSVVVPAVYLAKDAVATASYAYGTTLKQINDEINTGSNNNGWNGWRGGEVTETDWIQYEFPHKLELTGSTIRWFEDGGGVVLPASIAFQYYDEDSDSWKEVVPTGDAWTFSKEADSVYTFEKITTNKIKLIITNGTNSQNNRLGAYICEWSVTGRRWAPTKAELQAVITEADALEEAHYTADSYTVLADALEAAQAVTAKDAPTPDELIEALNALQAAIAGLRYTKAGLTANLAAAPKDTESSDYTEESWTAYTEVLAAVNAVSNSAEATDEQIDAAVRALQAAIAGLAVIPADKTALTTALEKSPKEADAPKYTKASWTPYKIALDQANAVMAKANPKQSEVNKAVSDLTSAKNGLVEKNTDMTALAEAISNAPTASDKKPYMVNSWAVYEKVLNAAKAVSEKDEPTQEEVDEAASKLNEAAAAITAYSTAMQKAQDEEPNESKYTEESWAVLLEAVKSLAELERNTQATLADINSVTEALDGAVKGLTLKEPVTVDKSKLAAAIAKAPKETDKDTYTEDSWKKMEDALTAANTINDKADATQTEVDKAAGDLEAAIDALVKKTSDTGASKEAIEALKNAVDAAKGLNKADYTDASWNIFKAALDAAEQILGREDADQESVETATVNLKEAQRKLVKKASAPTVTNKKKTLVVGETFSVAAKGYTYTTSDKKTASVSKKGIVKALKGGKTVTIKAVSKDKKKVVQYKVTIKKAPSKIARVTYKVKGEKKAKNIKLKKNKGTITLKRGKSATFKPALPNKTFSKFKYSFTSSKYKKLASISSKGVIKAKKKKGTVKVKIQTLNNKSVTITVKIK